MARREGVIIRMASTINVATHPDFTVDEFIAATGWVTPSKQNLSVALDYFQRHVPRSILRQPVTGSPWVPRINGTAIVLCSWLQGIDLGHPVNPARAVQKGDMLVAFKDPGVPGGSVRGNWFTVASTKQDTVAIHSTQVNMHKFKAVSTFSCMQSAVSDAYVAWMRELPAEYRRGGAQQLFIWNAGSVLAPA
jgi:hypothetical protein